MESAVYVYRDRGEPPQQNGADVDVASSCSQAKLAMRAEAHELQYGGVRLPIDQHQVWLDVTIPVVFPVASQCVVTVFLSQWLVFCQGGDNRDEIALQCLTVRSFGFAF